MFRILSLLTISLLGLTVNAADLEQCNTQTQLKCEVTYLNDHGGFVQNQVATDNFKDENWDEPSLSNCAATAYVHSDFNPVTSVRIYASKDLNSNDLYLSASTTQIRDIMHDGQLIRLPYYTYAKDINSTMGSEVNFNPITLALPADSGAYTVTKVKVSCTAK